MARTGPHREPPSAFLHNKRLGLGEGSAQHNKTQVAAPKTTIHTAPHASPGPAPVLPHIDPSKTHVQRPLKRDPWSIAAAVQRTCKKRRTNSHTCCCKPGSSTCAAAAVCNCTACVKHVPLVTLTAALHRVTHSPGQKQAHTAKGTACKQSRHAHPCVLSCHGSCNGMVQALSATRNVVAQAHT